MKNTKKMEQRLQQDDKRYTDLKRQNEEDIKLLNDLNALQVVQKNTAKEQVANWETALEAAKTKFDAAKTKVDKNRSAIDDLIKAIISTGGDQFIGPESERPKKEIPGSDKEQQKLLDLFGL